MFSVKCVLKNALYRLRADYTTEKLVSMGLVVGKNFKRMNGTIIDPSHCWLITIGDDVTMAPRVHILAHDASTCAIVGHARIGNVDIGNNVFVGAGSIILPGVNIGDNVVIGAGSVVSKSIPSGNVAAGNPAKVIMSYDEYVKKTNERFEVASVFDESYTLRNRKMTKEMKREMKKLLLDKVGFVE